VAAYIELTNGQTVAVEGLSADGAADQLDRKQAGHLVRFEAEGDAVVWVNPAHIVRVFEDPPE
jgi:hypothetical protein